MSFEEVQTPKRAALFFVLCLGAALAVYGPFLRRDFTYDDLLVVRDNAFIEHPSNLARLHGNDYLSAAGEQTYRPVVTACYIVEHLLYGKRAAFFSFTGVLLHACSAWMLGLLLVRWKPHARAPAVLASLFYVAHPALVEAVISPGNREETLSVALMLASALAWRRGRDRIRAATAGSIGLYVLALHTMEWSAALPVILAAWLWIGGASLREAFRSVRSHAAVAAAFLAMYFTVYPHAHVDTEWLGGGPAGGLLAFGRLFWSYVRLAILPVALRPHYVYVEPALAVRALGTAAMIAVGAVTVAGLVRRRPWSFGLLIFGLGLAPVSHIVMPFWMPMAERYLALPMIGGAPLMAAALWKLERKPATVFTALILLCFATLTAARAYDWKNGLHLWGDAVERQPEDPVAWSNFAASLTWAGRADEAARGHEIAFRLADKQGTANGHQAINLARALVAADRRHEACRFLAYHGDRFRHEREYVAAAIVFCRDQLASGPAENE
ncbi:MAG: hypothetical protein M5R36_23495 [Deltaproteobacteria bacterium]|nr:hypothetical protein [Deltaproteobacteria bacterium]